MGRGWVEEQSQLVGDPKRRVFATAASPVVFIVVTALTRRSFFSDFFAGPQDWRFQFIGLPELPSAILPGRSADWHAVPPPLASPIHERCRSKAPLRVLPQMLF